MKVTQPKPVHFRNRRADEWIIGVLLQHEPHFVEKMNSYGSRRKVGTGEYRCSSEKHLKKIGTRLRYNPVLAGEENLAVLGVGEGRKCVLVQ